MNRQVCLLLVATALVVPAGVGAQVRGGAVPPAIRLAPIDRQVVRDQDAMTWADDYRRIPGVCGSFNGPGGLHRRWPIPVTEGGAAPAGLLLRQRIHFGFTDSAQVLRLNRDGLARSGLAVGRVTARAVKPAAGELTGILVRLVGELPHDRTPADDPVTNPLSQGKQNYNEYTLEVVQRIGYDSFLPSHGVLITKNKARR